TGISTQGNHGVMLRQRGFRPMPFGVTESMQAVVGTDVKLIERWWNVSSAEPKDQIAIYALSGETRPPSPSTLGEGGGEGPVEVGTQKAEGRSASTRRTLSLALSLSTGRGSEALRVVALPAM